MNRLLSLKNRRFAVEQRENIQFVVKDEVQRSDSIVEGRKGGYSHYFVITVDVIIATLIIVIAVAGVCYQRQQRANDEHSSSISSYGSTDSASIPDDEHDIGTEFEECDVYAYSGPAYTSEMEARNPLFSSKLGSLQSLSSLPSDTTDEIIVRCSLFSHDQPVSVQLQFDPTDQRKENNHAPSIFTSTSVEIITY